MPVCGAGLHVPQFHVAITRTSLVLASLTIVACLPAEAQPHSLKPSNGVEIQGSGHIWIQKTGIAEAQKFKSFIRAEHRVLKDATDAEGAQVIDAKTTQRLLQIEDAKRKLRTQAIEAAKKEVLDAARQVRRQEAIDAVMAAAQELEQKKRAEQIAEEHLVAATKFMDKVNNANYKPDLRLAAASDTCSTCECSFIDRHGKNSECDDSYDLRELVQKWIEPVHKVIEIGAMYGTTSCAIAARQFQSGNLVVVEPDHRNWVSLEINRLNHKCDFRTVRGLIGNHDMKAVETESGVQLLSANSTEQIKTLAIIPHMSMKEVEARHSMNFDTAVIDCDGCLPKLVHESPTLFAQLRLAIVAVHDKMDEGALQNLVEATNFHDVESVEHLVRHVDDDGKECAQDGIVFQWSGASATKQACIRSCADDARCSAMSGEFYPTVPEAQTIEERILTVEHEAHWCKGCRRLLPRPESSKAHDATAYAKTSSIHVLSKFSAIELVESSPSTRRHVMKRLEWQEPIKVLD